MTHNAEQAAPTGQVRSRNDHLTLVTLVAASIGLWVVLHGYQGLTHDARLYTLQALSRLHPELFAQDLFLHFGSQDRFTFFSPLYAGLIEWLGLERSAALLTFFSHAALYAGAALVARQLLPAPMALVAVGLLVVVPTDYGPSETFHVIESFLTPRLAAEALVFFGVWAALIRRNWIATLFLAAALMLHPLMAMAGVAFTLALTVALPHPRVAIALVAAAAAGLTIFAFAQPEIRIDDAWYEVMLDRMNYVFVTTWSLEGWARALVPLSVLAVGLMVLDPSRARQAALIGILIGLGGLALTLLGADLLRVALIAQSQPWRWLWLANVIAILLLPAIIGACWGRGHIGRTTLALLISTWLFRHDAYCMVLMPSLLLSAFYSNKHVPTNAARKILFGALAVLALGVAWNIANDALFISALYEPHSVSTLRFFRELARSGVLPVTLFILIWLGITRVPGVPLRTGLVAAVALACLGMAPIAAAEWTHTRFTKPVIDGFDAWRRHIPVGTEVLWMDVPIDGWVLLQRPLYLSIDQTGSALFSRAAAIEIQRRDGVLAQYVPEARLMKTNEHLKAEGPTTLARVCASGEIRFIVTRMDLGPEVLEPVPEQARAFRGLRLYGCKGQSQ